jgi:hypothetical protein
MRRFLFWLGMVHHGGAAWGVVRGDLVGLSCEQQVAGAIAGSLEAQQGGSVDKSKFDGVTGNAFHGASTKQEC